MENLADIVLGELLESDDFVNPVEELRPHRRLELLLRRVGGHNKDGILEIHRTALVVGQTTVVQNLKEDVEYLALVGGVCAYLMFVKSDEEPKDPRLLKLKEFLSFKKMIIEGLLKATYIVFALFVTLYSFLIMVDTSFITGLMLLILLNILLRIGYEASLIVLLIWRNTSDISKKLGKSDLVEEINEMDETTGSNPGLESTGLESEVEAETKVEAADIESETKVEEPVVKAKPRTRKPKTTDEKEVKKPAKKKTTTKKAPTKKAKVEEVKAEEPSTKEETK